MKPLSILVADDEEDIRALLQVWLQGAGHTVTQAGGAKEAISLFRQQPFDLVITDVLMPDGDGLELIGALRKTQAAVPVVAISGGGRYIEGNNCLKIARGFGAQAAVMKPFSRDQLFAGIDLALAPAI